MSPIVAANGGAALAVRPVASPMRRMLVACALIYPLLILHGSLFPLSTWRASGLPPFAFLSADFPRYWTGFDLAINVALYFPLGFLWAMALLRADAPRTIWRLAAMVIAVLAASAFSLAVEVLQNWLPSRVPSNLDWLCNTAGAFIGAALAFILAPRGGKAGSGREGAPGLLAAGPGSTFAGVLIVLWMVAQLSPQNLLFASGLAETRAAGWLPEISEQHRLAAEATAVALHFLVAGLLLRALLASRYLGFIGRLCLVGLLVVAGKAAVSGLGLGLAQSFYWLSNASLWGVGAGAGLVAVTAIFPARGRVLISFGAMVVGSVLLLMLSTPPYAPAVERDLAASALRNFVGTVNAVGVVWPFLLVGHLLWMSRHLKRRSGR